MDDQNFSQKTALDWISTIEDEKSLIRDTDIYPKLKTWISRGSPLEILEVGSGQGICSDKIDLNGRNYTGIEPSPHLVDRAKELYRRENRNFLLGNAYDLPFSNGVFDAVFSVAVWHLLSDQQKAAEEFSRVLKANGHFLIITANPGAYSLWTDAYADTRLDGKRFEGKTQLFDQPVTHDVLYLHTLDEIMNSLQAAHLKVEEIKTFRPSGKPDDQKKFISIQGQKIIKT